MNSMYNPFSLKDRKILITGASSGIGRQCAIECSRMGAKIVLIGRNEERLMETYSSLEGTNHIPIVANIIDFNEFDHILSDCLEKDGPVNGFLHVAGIERTLPLRNLKPDDYMDLYKTNFVSGVNILKIISKKNNYVKGCKVVFISSITASIARVGTLAYTASKGAILSAVRELAVELASKGINVNCISPGTVLTPMMKEFLSELSEEEKKKRLEGFPIGIGEPQDIALASIFLLSDGARWITGQNLIIDGGYTVM